MMIATVNTTLLGVNESCPNIDAFRNQVYSTVYSMLTFFGFFGNSFALYILIRTYNQKTAFHIYMMNLAVSDLLFIFTLPLRVVYYTNTGNWFFGDALCRISSYAFYVNLYCSIFILTAMSFFRFVAIVFPVRNLRLVNVRNAKIVCAVIWIFVTLTAIPFLMSGTYENNNKTKCFEPPTKTSAVTTLKTINFLSLIFCFLIPFLVILICYTLIIKTLLKNAMNKQQATRKKAIRMIIIVMAVFFISFMPYHIQRTVHLQYLQNKTCEERHRMQKSVVITLALAASNCCFDPLLYFFSGENFRKRLSTLRKPSESSLRYSCEKKKSFMTHEKRDAFKENKQDSNES
uniref:Cysteinyl leukotriene receptor 1 n=1 Tax=Geotrypetes seraphini TaxID=260995 RepID=A0A6P8RG65_GEOSA|nr:cysteinyl leukotriene receptor 1 [Geotrypetes seraphini]XP_033803008.1 cysteinyl leukotriene receptor 1 [Geotrypetes seraphini]XP_033803009.1 cysteinyl leukotriene receptor 1 [Geotrypetes seraphini]XP_033803010.1 cysteinyl leukotriene receptor 1 [Geotrypetes seraphini]